MYKTAEMVYSHNYKWNAKEDDDNPKIINGNEASELNWRLFNIKLSF